MSMFLFFQSVNVCLRFAVPLKPGSETIFWYPLYLSLLIGEITVKWGRRQQEELANRRRQRLCKLDRLMVAANASQHHLLQLQIQLSLSLSFNSKRNYSSTLVEEEPDSPTSPPRTAPDGYSPLISEYGSPPLPFGKEVHCNGPTDSYTSHAMDAFQSVQDDEPFNFHDSEDDDLFRPTYDLEHVRTHLEPSNEDQAIELAEIVLKYHNDDPSNGVKCELIKGSESNYMLEGSSNYGHVNFTARPKQEGSEEQLFFTELCLLEDFTTLT